MSWTSTFIIYRVTSGGEVSEVFGTDDPKKAKYWLTYIGQSGDALCRTPNHPKHTGKAPSAEYWTHKEESGKLFTDEKRWNDLMAKLHGSFALPTDGKVRYDVE
jgi:hypothetical protein